MTMIDRLTPTVRLRYGALETVTLCLACQSDAQTAQVLGVSPATVSRARHGRAVSGTFVAAVLHSCPIYRFEDLFAIHVPDDLEAAA